MPQRVTNPFLSKSVVVSTYAIISAMPARDILRDIVKEALIKDGWIITHDPFTVSFGIRTVYVDLGVERLLGVQRGNDKLVIEVKSFVGMSKIADLERALGQYMIYQSWLKRTHPDRVRYVAIDDVAHKAIFLDISGQVLIEDYAIRMIIVDAAKQEIVQWIQ